MGSRLAIASPVSLRYSRLWTESSLSDHTSTRSPNKSAAWMGKRCVWDHETLRAYSFVALQQYSRESILQPAQCECESGVLKFRFTLAEWSATSLNVSEQPSKYHLNSYLHWRIFRGPTIRGGTLPSFLLPQTTANRASFSNQAW